MAISPNPPPLPPRPNMDTSEHIDFLKLGTTPPAWLCALIRYNPGEDNHQHEFFLSTQFDSKDETVFLCQECHSWFFLTTSNTNLEGGCSNSESNLHHFHTTTMSRTTISANCCLCRFAVNIEIKEPFISMRLFNRLDKLRKHTYANAVKHNEYDYEHKTSLVDVIDNMIIIVDDVLNDNLHNLKIHCEIFEKIGLDEASQAFFEQLGFRLMDGRLIPPVVSEHSEFKQTKEELTMISFMLNNYLKYDAKKPYEKLNNILGTTYKSSRYGSCSDFDPEKDSGAHLSQSSCSFLGCVPEMDDQILVWAYKLGIKDAPERAPEYLQAIYEMSKERKSEALQEQVAIEKSEGKFHKDDINEAYKCLKSLYGDVDFSAVSDDFLIETYSALNNDDSSGAKQREALSIVGKDRKSAKISRFLSEGGANGVFDFFSEMPVGLDNIGNTCYLNSLLQYYFTIRQLRKAVLDTDLSGTNGYELDWQSITIGHRKISKSEVERAKKFVALLRGLFVNLIHTAHRSISPDIDLAYLALVNAKNDEDEYKDASRSPMELSSTSYDNKMAIDDSSPGPSYTVSEELTVEMEGTAPSAIDDIQGFFDSASHSFKGKEKDTQTNGQSDYFNTTKEDKLRAASEMLLGRQQDVTECMDNVMFQLEAALKSLSVTDENGNVIKSLFYGQTRQILHKTQNTGEPLTKEESFNHLIVVVDEGRDLYDGLDVYFDASLVEYDGTQAVREVVITELPPILQIHVQRVQFDRSTSNVYKSNAFLRFEKVIYLDRYLEKNYELLKQRRKEAYDWRQDIDRLQAELEDYERDKTTALPMVDLLRSTTDFIHDMKNDITVENIGSRLSTMERESERINVKIKEGRNRISHLKSQLRQHYQDLRECEYHLHAVFIHSGQANFGHYWIYIFDFEKDRWLKFNDSYVTEVEDREVFADTTGSSANPYCMVYVRAKDAKELVESVCRQTN